MKRSTLKDIAKLTGLSVSGVSRALKDHPDISPETKDKVKEVAAALNYHPNPSAQFLRTKSSKIIAVILPEVNTFFFPEILQGISKVVEQHGYSLIFLQSDNSIRKEKELIDYCLQMFVDGVLISLSGETTNLEHILKLKETETSVVLIDRILENKEVPYLTINDAETSFRAVDYLIKKGHSNILGIFDDDRLSMTRLRADGFRLAHARNGIDLNPNQILTITDDHELEAQITNFLDEHPSATAVFTMSDKLMVKTYHVINSLGFKIPDDMALVSISDGKAPYYLYPGITHMRHSGEEVGTTATNLLFELLSGKKPDQDIYEIATVLVELGSV
ncbi:MAG: LacI family DNA-binding transcriptional regulator [Bacteroidetes bacterium]|nr:LacI family DNA-binding transcriptional regulator [Bacteroidota bacterium]